MIYVFRTSVQNKKQLNRLKPHIDNLLPHVKWNFDLEDIDKIFRIEHQENLSLEIINFFRIHEFNCEELE